MSLKILGSVIHDYVYPMASFYQILTTNFTFHLSVPFHFFQSLLLFLLREKMLEIWVLGLSFRIPLALGHGMPIFP